MSAATVEDVAAAPSAAATAAADAPADEHAMLVDAGAGSASSSSSSSSSENGAQPAGSSSEAQDGPPAKRLRVESGQEAGASTSASANADANPPAASSSSEHPGLAAAPDFGAPSVLYCADDVSGDGSPGDPDTKFVVITNDDSEQSLVWLVAVKEIFSKQLPKMPKEYIVRLVMDRSHRSMVCVRNGSVVGGICFRPYKEQQFAEIAFLAITGTLQVKGYGTRLMNQLKQYAKTIKLTHFLTYADNFALGYFSKQGFTKHITMPRERWAGYIKDYDGGTLMECVINSYVDYNRIPALIARNREFLLARLTEISKAHIVYPGLAARFFKGLAPSAAGGDGAADGADDDGAIRNIYEQVPGIKDAGWKPPVAGLRRGALGHTSNAPGGALNGGAGDAVDPELQHTLRNLLKKVTAHRDAWPFHEPVPESVVDYLDVIKNPIDLSLIRRRLETGTYYTSKEMLLADLQLMTDNCKVYNAESTTYHASAVRLEEFFTPLFESFGASVGSTGVAVGDSSSAPGVSASPISASAGVAESSSSSSTTSSALPSSSQSMSASPASPSAAAAADTSASLAPPVAASGAPSAVQTAQASVSGPLGETTGSSHTPVESPAVQAAEQAHGAVQTSAAVPAVAATGAASAGAVEAEEVPKAPETGGAAPQAADEGEAAMDVSTDLGESASGTVGEEDGMDSGAMDVDAGQAPGPSEPSSASSEAAPTGATDGSLPAGGH